MVDLRQFILDKYDGKIGISFTLLSTFSRCPRRKLLELAVDSDLWRQLQNQRNFIAGSVVHNAFSAWVEFGFPDDYLTNAELIGDMFDQYVNKLVTKKHLPVVWNTTVSKSIRERWGVSTDYDYNKKKAIRACASLGEIAKSLGLVNDSLFSEMWLEVDHPFDGRFVLKGAVDILDPVSDFIFDIKVTENTSYGNELQLAFYGLLVAAVADKIPSKAAFIYPLGSKVSKPICPEEKFAYVVKEITEFIIAFDAMRFPAVVSRDCNYCPVQGWCSAQDGVFDFEESLND